MAKAKDELRCRGRVLLYTRRLSDGRSRVTIDGAPEDTEEVGRLIRRWQRHFQRRGERFEGFRVQRKHPFTPSRHART